MTIVLLTNNNSLLSALINPNTLGLLSIFSINVQLVSHLNKLDEALSRLKNQFYHFGAFKMIGEAMLGKANNEQEKKALVPSGIEIDSTHYDEMQRESGLFGN